jgi:thioesterase domain-containing protein
MRVQALRNPDGNSRSVAPLWRLVSPRGGSLVTFNEHGDSPPLYCVHSITGDVAILQDLAGFLGPTQSLYGIQVPKEKMTSAFASSIEVLARHHVRTLVTFQPEGPIILAGWSAGAIIALEMAQQLRAIGREVPLLVALDGAPCNTGAGVSPWNPMYCWWLLRNLPAWLREGQFHHWSLLTFGKRIAERLSFRFSLILGRLEYGQILPDARIQHLLDRAGWSGNQTSFIRALNEAGNAYVPKPYGGNVVVYEARTQPLFRLLQIGAAWEKIAHQPEIILLDGGHGSIFDEPSISTIGRHLAMRLAELRRADENGTG